MLARRSRPPKAKLRALAALDGRSATVRAVRAVQAGLVSDLGGDLTVAQHLLVERAALTAAICQASESAWLVTGEVDPAYLSAVATLSRLLKQIGTERTAKDVTDLSTYIATKESA